LLVDNGCQHAYSTDPVGYDRCRDEGTMGIADRAKNAIEETVGKVKEVVGDVTGNDELKAEGLKDQGVSGVKKVGENIKDALS
jgi:uncharacterized protein YjbJ (UPF0337 family)